MEIITGYTGKKHITAEMDRDVNIGIVGGDSYVLVTGSQLEAEVSSNNEIKIKDGVVMHQGCAGSIKKNTYDSITISNGSQGMKRIDLLVLRYERNQDTNIELLTLKVLQGTPAESSPTIPQYTVGDIQSGDSVSDMPLYEIELDGINVTEVRKVFKMCMTNADLSDSVRTLNANSIVETGDKYVKYADGRLVQWGRITIAYTDGYGTITFPVPFAGTNGNDYFLFAQPKYINSSFRHELLSAQKISLSKAALYSNQVDGKKTETHVVDWHAIGRWK